MSLFVAAWNARARTQLRCPLKVVLRELASSQRWMPLSWAPAKTNRPAGSKRHDSSGLLCRSSVARRVRVGSICGCVGAGDCDTSILRQEKPAHDEPAHDVSRGLGGY